MDMINGPDELRRQLAIADQNNADLRRQLAEAQNATERAKQAHLTYYNSVQAVYDDYARQLAEKQGEVEESEKAVAKWMTRCNIHRREKQAAETRLATVEGALREARDTIRANIVPTDDYNLDVVDRFAIKYVADKIDTLMGATRFDQITGWLADAQEGEQCPTATPAATPELAVKEKPKELRKADKYTCIECGYVTMNEFLDRCPMCSGKIPNHD